MTSLFSPNARWWAVALFLGGGSVTALAASRSASSPPSSPPGGALAPLFPSSLGPVPEQTPPRGLATLSAQECNACHGEVHDQWARSGHSQAWKDPVWREAMEKASNPVQCLHCHTPLVNQQRQLIVSYDGGDPNRPRLAPNSRFDPTLQAEGVTCSVCHVRDGVVYGTRRVDSAQSPHPVEVHPELQKGKVCASCHQLSWPGTEGDPYYDTVGEWQDSAYARAGVGCTDCHMPYVAGVLSGTRFAGIASHDIRGGSDDAMLVRALTLTLQTDRVDYGRGDPLKVTAEIRNTGAGHAVPTTDPFHQVELRLRVMEGSEVRQEKRFTFTRTMSSTPPYRETSDTRLQAGELRTLEWQTTLPASPGGGGALRLVAEGIYRTVPEEVATRHGKEPGQYQRVFLKQETDLFIH